MAEERGVFFCYCGDEGETMHLGGEMARWSRRGDVWLLEGELGVGKTSFARGFIRRVMGEETVVPSPTYSLVQYYEGGGEKIFHYDLYRMGEEDSLYDVGWEEAMGGVSLVEWAERLKVRNFLSCYWRVLWREECGDVRRLEVWRKGEEREEEGCVGDLRGFERVGILV